MRVIFCVCALLLPACLLWPSQEIVDRIAALVNDEVITESDIGIIEAFGLIDEEDNRVSSPSRETFLNLGIDRKLVVQLFGENESVGDEEFAVLISDLKDRYGLQAFEKKLEEFGLAEADLHPYLAEQLIYRRIITRRFNQAVRVSLQEMETYYRTVYVPEAGPSPPPLTEVLGEVESRIKRSKVREKVRDWLSNLRRQGEIQIMNDGALAGSSRNGYSHRMRQTKEK